MKHNRRRKLLVGVVAGASLLSSCVQPGRDGVTLQAIDAALVFGVPPEIEAASAAPAAVTPPAPYIPSSPGIDLTTKPFFPIFPRIPKNLLCPEAPAAATPEHVIGPNITAGPTEGLYQFLTTIERPLENEKDGPILVPRALRDVTRLADDRYRFEVVQVVDEDTIVEFTYEVFTAGESVVLPNEAGAVQGVPRTVDEELEALEEDAANIGDDVDDTYDEETENPKKDLDNLGSPANLPDSATEPIPASPVPAPSARETTPDQLPRAGEPEGGVILRAIRYYDSEGNQASGRQAFEPQVGLLLLPLPVVSEQTYQSVSVDPSTGETRVLDAAVRFRERIDACGELVDGWLVESSLTIVAGGVRTVWEYDYIVGTGMGGLILDEHLVPDNNSMITTAHIAGLTPDELPEALGS